MLGYLHETRVRFLRSLGDFNELNMGSGLVVAELNCLYKSECFYSDEIEVVQELK